MKGFGMASMALGFGGLYGTAYASGKKEGGPGAQGECKLLPLPYPNDALEPWIDKETVTIHHDKHHAGYVKNFNIALRKLSEARESGDHGLIKHWSRELAFHGSGHVLHTLYWANMSPKGGGKPKGELLEAMQKSFGGYDTFAAQFAAATNAVEASGWGILAFEPFRGYLVVLQGEKHQDDGQRGEEFHDHVEVVGNDGGKGVHHPAQDMPVDVGPLKGLPELHHHVLQEVLVVGRSPEKA